LPGTELLLMTSTKKKRRGAACNGAEVDLRHKDPGRGPRIDLIYPEIL
jgi:hypothetical protein